LNVDDVGPVGPPWLDYRGPPGKCCGPGRTVRLLDTPAATQQDTEYPSTPKILPVNGPNQKQGFCTRL
jgi:hypothetical protein